MCVLDYLLELRHSSSDSSYSNSKNPSVHLYLMCGTNRYEQESIDSKN